MPLPIVRQSQISIADYLTPSPVVTQFTDPFSGSALIAGWTAAQPAKVSISGGVLSFTSTTSGYFDNHLYRSENLIDGKMSITVQAGATITAQHGPVARRQSSGACYVVNTNIGGNLALYSVSAAGSPTQIAAVSTGYTYANGYTCTLETIGISPTMVIATMYDLSGNHIATCEVSNNTAALQFSSPMGIACWNTGSVQIDSATAYTRSPLITQPRISLGAIGDSIYQGTGTSGGINTTASVLSTKITAMSFLPCSVNNQAISGKTTTDWLPAGSLLTPALASFLTTGANVVTIMLGTNDVKESVKTSTATTLANLTSIANTCLATTNITTVFIHNIPYHGVNGTDFNGASLARAQALNDSMASICNGYNIILGDTGSMAYFAGNPTLLGDNLHPNDGGAVVLGSLHARAIRIKMGL